MFNSPIHSYSYNSPTHSYLCNSPTHLFNSPTHSYSCSSPTHSYSCSSPTHSYSYNSPTHSYSYNSPTHSYSYNSPTHSYSYNSPTHSYSYNSPTHSYSYNSPTHSYSYNSPTHSYSYNSPTHSYSCNSPTYSFNSLTHSYNSPIGLYTSFADFYNLSSTIFSFGTVMSSVHLVNVNVSLLHPIKTLLPWTILQVREINYSIKDFFLNTVVMRLPDDSYCLEAAQIGRDKSILDNVDINLPILPVISSFGLYLRYSVSGGNGTSSVASEVIEIDANTSHPLSSVLHPIQQERTQKDKLYNDLIHYLASFSVSLKVTELEEGKKLLVTLQSIFWHIDGHQHVFKERAVGIPSFFNSFTDYNMPQRSKHRKRLTSNLSSDVLRDLALDLSMVLNNAFWEREQWTEIRPHFNELLLCISSYCDYLVMKNKRVKEDHRSPTPVREISQNIHIKYLSSSERSVMPLLKSVEDRITDLPLYQFFLITDLLPSDRFQKHRAVDLLISSGLSVPTVLLIYTPGGNIGSAHFLWRVPPDVDATDCFDKSQICIEEIKKQLPSYHTRAMRAALYQKIGRVSSKVKPAVLRYFYKELTGKHIIDLNTNFNVI